MASREKSLDILKGIYVVLINILWKKNLDDAYIRIKFYGKWV